MVSILAGRELARARKLANIAGEKFSATALLSTNNEWFVSRCKRSGILPLEQKKLLQKVITLLCGALVLSLLLQKAIFLLFIPAIIGFELLGIHKKEQERIANFESDYPAFLLSLASSLKAGQDPIVALAHGAQLFIDGSAMRHELDLVKTNIELGLRENEILRLFAKDINLPDINLFRAAFILAREHGGALGESLERLARVTRQRQSFRRKVSASIAMQKLSAYGIGLCAIVMTSSYFGSNTAIFMKAWNHSLGFKLLILGAFLMLAGIGWMTQMSRRFR